MISRLASLFLLATLVACGSSPATAPAAEVTSSPDLDLTAMTTTPPLSPPTTSPIGLRDCELLDPPGRCANIDVGGYDLWIVCRGSGSPTIVLEAGFGEDSRAWNRIIRDVTTISQVCVYDRAGVGSSDPPPQSSRTSQHIVTDLHTLLTQADIPGPYVLVGHSLGGFHIRLFADQYRDMVSGMVLVDASFPQQEQLFGPLEELLPPETPRECPILKELRSEAPQDKPEGNPERLDVAASGVLVAATQDLGALPLAVLTAGKPPSFPSCVPQPFVERSYEIWLELQAKLVTLSTNSIHIMATKSGHHIQRDEPDVVIDAIRQVVTAARSGDRLGTQ